MPEYGDHKYWNKRYQDQKVKTFDWLQDYNAVKFVIERICKKESKILMLGCGNSLMSEEMYNDGYENIYNIDISEIVIEQMNEMHKHLENMTYEVMDCTDLKYPDGFFDVVIDKSTIDAILCGENPDMMAAKTTKEVQRVLKTSGVYCAISYGFPEYRMCHFNMPHLSFEIEIIEMIKEEANTRNKSTHHIYLCQKREDADRISQAKWAEVEEDLLLGEDKRLNFIQKYSRQNENELEGLEVKSDDYTGAGNERNDASDLSDDPDFLNKIMGGDLTDGEIGAVMENIKEDMNKVF